MQFKHAPAAVSAVFDDPNLVSAAGLVPMLRLARSAGLDQLAQVRLTVPSDKGANAGGKVMALVAGLAMEGVVAGQQQLANQLAYLLPLEPAQKLQLLQLDDPELRLSQLQAMVEHLQGDAS